MAKRLRFKGSTALHHYCDAHIELFPGGFAKIPEEISEEDALAKVKDFGAEVFEIEDDGPTTAARAVDAAANDRMAKDAKGKRAGEK